ncbi:MAG TPA: lipid-binding SYLF domain-containing protein [Candidatus Eisenbacteria bacterium]|nr:lipid-binding SYLF domain-containing protein [Candidatus Eisenbacteria bacterium]
MTRRWKWGGIGVACLLSVTLAIGASPLRADDKDKSKDEAQEKTHADRVLRARDVYVEFVNSKDHEVPKGLRDRAKAIAVFPKVVKGAIGFGGRYGKGVISYHMPDGHWSPVTFLTMTGGSWGLQIGVESADVILYFMTDESVKSLLQSKFTLGGKAGVAAGPFGRTAEADTDVKLNAEIYSYARSKGLFAGVSLEGARVAPDQESVRDYYGQEVSPQTILFQGEVPSRPAAGEAFVQVLP